MNYSAVIASQKQVTAKAPLHYRSHYMKDKYLHMNMWWVPHGIALSADDALAQKMKMAVGTGVFVLLCLL